MGNSQVILKCGTTLVNLVTQCLSLSYFISEILFSNPSMAEKIPGKTRVNQVQETDI